MKDGPNNDIQNGRLGLFRLGSELDAGTGDTTSGLDIVAIHGLNGDFGSTWTHSNGTFWLRDLLPQAMPGCRVFSYGYPSQIAFSRSVASIRDYALSLLNWIEQEQGHPVSALSSDTRAQLMPMLLSVAPLHCFRLSQSGRNCS